MEEKRIGRIKPRKKADSSFLQELRDSTRTKAENEEAFDSSWRSRLEFSIKHDISYKAAKGEFEKIGNKKRISGFYNELRESAGDGETQKVLMEVEFLEKKVVKSSVLFNVLGGDPVKYKITQKISATPWFIKQLNLLQKELEQDGLIGIKISSAFRCWNEKIIAKEYVYSYERSRDSITGKLYETRSAYSPAIYYELEY